MGMLMVREVSWWYWLVTAIFLTFGVAGRPEGFWIALALSAVQVVHFLLREGSAAAFPVQVRTAYFALLLVAQWPPLRWLYWIPCIGTWAVVLVGYCLLARIVSLAPWNRAEPLTPGLLARTFLSPPVRGSILQGLPPGPGRSEGEAADRVSRQPS